MKKIFVLRVMVLTLLFHLPLLAQDTDMCMQDLSIFAEFAKVKNYKSAFQPWMKVRTSCPSLNFMENGLNIFLKEEIRMLLVMF